MKPKQSEDEKSFRINAEEASAMRRPGGLAPSLILRHAVFFGGGGRDSSDVQQIV